MKDRRPVRMVLTLQAGFQVSGWKSEIERQRRVLVLKRPEGVQPGHLRTRGILDTFNVFFKCLGDPSKISDCYIIFVSMCLYDYYSKCFNCIKVYD